MTDKEIFEAIYNAALTRNVSQLRQTLQEGCINVLSMHYGLPVTPIVRLGLEGKFDAMMFLIQYGAHAESAITKTVERNDEQLEQTLRGQGSCLTNNFIVRPLLDPDGFEAAVKNTPKLNLSKEEWKKVIAAVSVKGAKAVIDLLELHNLSIEEEVQEKRIAIFVAAMNGRDEFVQSRLIDYPEHFFIAACGAAVGGQDKLLQQYLDYIPLTFVEARKNHMRLVILYAAQVGQVEIVNQLLTEDTFLFAIRGAADGGQRQLLKQLLGRVDMVQQALPERISWALQGAAWGVQYEIINELAAQHPSLASDIIPKHIDNMLFEAVSSTLRHLAFIDSPTLRTKLLEKAKEKLPQMDKELLSFQTGILNYLMRQHLLPFGELNTGLLCWLLQGQQLVTGSDIKGENNDEIVRVLPLAIYYQITALSLGCSPAVVDKLHQDICRLFKQTLTPKTQDSGRGFGLFHKFMTLQSSREQLAEVTQSREFVMS